MDEGDGMDEISLDETLKMDAGSGASALAKLKAHSVEIEHLRIELTKLETPGTGVAELRRVVEDAARMQASLGVEPEHLTRELLMEAGVPVDELEQARSLAAAVAASEAACDKARQHLEGGKKNSSPTLFDDLERLLRSWEDLKQLEARLRAQIPRLPVSHVDLGMDRRKSSIGPLCDALLDLAIEMQTSMFQTAVQAGSGEEDVRSEVNQLDDRLRALVSEEWVQRVLTSLEVEIPSSDIFQHGTKGIADVGSGSRTPTPPRRPRSRTSSPPAKALGTAQVGSGPGGAFSPPVPAGGMPTFAAVGDDSTTTCAFAPGDESTGARFFVPGSPVASAIDLSHLPGPAGASSRIAPDDATPLATPGHGMSESGTPPLTSDLRDQAASSAAAAASAPRGSAASGLSAPALAVPAAAAAAVLENIMDSSPVSPADRLATTQGGDITFASVAKAASPASPPESPAPSAAASAALQAAAAVGASQPMGCSSPPTPSGGAAALQLPLAQSGAGPNGHSSQEGWPSAAPQAPPQGSKPMPVGSPALWHAVHVGDKGQIAAYVQSGQCDGRLLDASGHSVLWHACAFNHIAVAKLMIDMCPPNTEGGVNLAEVHPRRGDTLLHVLCQCRPFVKETAEIFQRVASGVPEGLILTANSAGVTFMALAASSLNFWVLKYVMLNFPGPVRAMACAEQQNPLRSIAEVIAKPTAPTFTPPNPLPEHFPVAGMLDGGTPFADVAFETGEPGKTTDGEYARYLAHRVVVATQSPTLRDEFMKLPSVDLSKDGALRGVVFRVDARISRNVWRSVLQFLYSGKINYSYNTDADRLLELMRACLMYKLPRPLLDYVQASLFQLLPTLPPSVALQAFSMCAGKGGEGLDVRATIDAATYILLRSGPAVFRDMEPKEVSRTLERMVEAIEYGVFNPATPPAKPPAQAPAAPPAQAPAAGVAAAPAANLGSAAVGQSAMANPAVAQAYAQGQQSPMQQSFGHQCWQAPGQQPAAAAGYPTAAMAAAQLQQQQQAQQLLLQQQLQQQQAQASMAPRQVGARP